MKKLGSVALLAAVGAWFLAGARRQKVVGKFRSLATRTLQPKAYDDATLKDKVEVPSQDLIDALVDRTQKIHGVREVESLLHTPGTEAPMHH
jgi:hypothetical protein